MNSILRVENLSKHFVSQSGPFWKKKQNVVRAVDDISFELGENEVLGLVGESGCGKSTTGSLLVRLLDPTSGSIFLNGKDIATLPEKELLEARKNIQLIFQDPFASLDPMMTLGEVVAEPWEIHGVHLAKDRMAEAAKLLEVVGLSGELTGRYPHELSGGQRQRVAIARALALDPRVLIADEPTSALDVSVKAQIINLLRDIRDSRGLSMVFISHDLSMVRHISNRLVVMYLGRIMEYGPTKEIFARPSHPYTRALLEAIPVPDPTKRKKRQPIRGEALASDASADLCPFHPRCPRSGPECSKQRPRLRELSPGCFTACFYPESEARPS